METTLRGYMTVPEVASFLSDRTVRRRVREGERPSPYRRHGNGGRLAVW